MWRFVNRWPIVYRVVTAFGAMLVRSLSVPGSDRRRWIKRLPLFGGAWTQHRDMPAPAAYSFQARWRQRRSGRES